MTKELRMTFTILATDELPDEMTYDEVQDYVDNVARELGIYEVVNDIEWELDK